MSSQDQFKDVQITTTLPRSWEEERTFNDVLYDWLGRAPYLAVAVALHLLAIFLAHLIDWNTRPVVEEKTIMAGFEPPPIDEIEDPPPPEPEVVEEPVIVDPVIVETTTEVVESEDVTDDMPFDNPNMSNVEIGIGGGGGGGSGRRASGRRQVKAPIQAALRDALEWLKDHQNEAGFWDCDGFMVECKLPGQPLSDGPGEPYHDVGVTGLAVLAFLGYGDTMNEGEYKDVINRAIQWLRSQQQESGLVGDEIAKEFMYSHAIATVALAEAMYTSKSPVLRSNVQRAATFITKAQNPYAGWRYSSLPDGNNDSSVTGWMVFALAAAQDAGVKVDPESYRGALAWFDEMTDGEGRVGYDKRGSGSSRPLRLLQQFPTDRTEALTAVATLGRFFALNALKTQDPKEEEYIRKGGDLMRRKLPVWSNDGSSNDMYYWYYGSYAMFQIGGDHWKDWERAMERAIMPNQRKDGCFKGSWDPNGPWGWSGGRVYSTALMALNLQVFFRYTKLTGAR
jgi:hypothetical protein